MKTLSILSARVLARALSLIKRGGSLPGQIALRIDPDVLSKLKYEGIVILVTGTNGKTSTSNMIADLMMHAGKTVISNRRGDNMRAGVATAILTHCSLSGKVRGNALVLEVDELNVRHLLPQLPVNAMVVTNFFRDQLDRAREMEQLIATLEAHQRNENYLKIKEVVPQLDQRYTYGRDFLTKEPEPLQPNKEYRYVHPKEDLKKAMLAVLARSDHKLPPPVSAFQGIVGREPYPVADKAGEILERLSRFGVTRFRALFKGNRSRSEVVATFIAVLELCKARRLRLAGTEEDCTVTSTGESGPEEVTAPSNGAE